MQRRTFLGRLTAALAAPFAAWFGQRPVEAGQDEPPSDGPCGCEAGYKACGYDPADWVVRIIGADGLEYDYVCQPSVCPTAFQGEITVSEVD